MIFPLSRFIQRLKDKFKLYKSEADGVQFVKSHNTSRTCHYCGNINKELDVKTRNWKCPKCGRILDRDINAGATRKSLFPHLISEITYFNPSCDGISPLETPN